MKRVLVGIAAAALVLSVSVTGAFAAGWGHGRNYTDANGDGVCDNYTGGGRYFVDANGDGVCDNCTGCGRYFVDADGDGVCDNCAGGGRYFVDANGDGVCDNHTVGLGCGTGHGGRGGHCR